VRDTLMFKEQLHTLDVIVVWRIVDGHIVEVWDIVPGKSAEIQKKTNTSNSTLRS